ncbi:helix-turn-helix domain-containing protein [Anaeroselena agilis]|uniref:XRE family transcriptional regulator n=1 Tax=Anaeroselena agilis TaxID=3063788 RepID=A0ABU3P272_9FIRM|nr:XRE family transcriptional regulator [Selenomonadales bacterium 4137-cl]
MLGKKIRDKRQEKGLTIRELATGADLTSGFLSQVERGLAEPSITSLRKIAAMLNVPIFYFLMDEQTDNLIVRKGARKVVKTGKGEVTFELLSPDLNRTIEMMVGRVEPGGVTCEEPLSHFGEENLVVVQGKMRIQIGQDFFELDEGDSIYYLSSIPHKIWSVGDQELIFISAITPPVF